MLWDFERGRSHERDPDPGPDQGLRRQAAGTAEELKALTGCASFEDAFVALARGEAAS